MPVWRDFFSLFPTYVGVIRNGNARFSVSDSVPHVCGGDPVRVNVVVLISGCSPRMWGWSLLRHAHWVRHFLFPTHVGVILRWLWRLFFHKLLFPTSVGVILKLVEPEACVVAVPHVCGSDPCITCYHRLFKDCSVPHVCGGDPSNQLAYNFAVPHECGGKSN